MNWSECELVYRSDFRSNNMSSKVFLVDHWTLRNKIEVLAEIYDRDLAMAILGAINGVQLQPSRGNNRKVV